MSTVRSQNLFQVSAAEDGIALQIRERPDWDSTAAGLKELGAELVTTDEKLEGALREAGLPAPVLALNCVGGQAVLALAKVLATGGTLVT